MKPRRPDPRELARKHNRAKSTPLIGTPKLRKAFTTRLTILRPDGSIRNVDVPKPWPGDRRDIALNATRPAGASWPGFRTWPYALTPDQMRAESDAMIGATT